MNDIEKGFFINYEAKEIESNAFINYQIKQFEKLAKTKYKEKFSKEGLRCFATDEEYKKMSETPYNIEKETDQVFTKMGIATNDIVKTFFRELQKDAEGIVAKLKKIDKNEKGYCSTKDYIDYLAVHMLIVHSIIIKEELMIILKELLKVSKEDDLKQIIKELEDEKESWENFNELLERIYKFDYYMRYFFE